MSWKKSNSNLFPKRAYFLEKYGKQSDEKRIAGMNKVKADNWACNTINDIRYSAIKYGLIDPETRFGEVSEMLANCEL